MTSWTVAFLALALLFLTLGFARKIRRTSPPLSRSTSAYQYRCKPYFLTRAEHAFYEVLRDAVGERYHIFAQVHLASIIEGDIPGQNLRR